MSSSSWRAIRLELTSTPDFPLGSAGRAYLLRLPLNEQGDVDEEAFLRRSHKATFQRHWASDPDESGRVHQSGSKWALRLPGSPDRVVEFSDRFLRAGQSATLADHDGVTLPLQIVSIR